MLIIRKVTQSLVLVATLLQTLCVNAHGMHVPINEDICSRWTGINLVHFSTYQPQFEEKAQYCTEIPKVGDAIVVIDLISKALRVIPIALRIVENDVASANKILLDIPARIYSAGVIESLVKFPHPGNYTAIVTISNGEEELVSQLQLHVELDNDIVSRGKLFALLLLGLFSFMFLRAMRKSRKQVKPT